MKKQVPANTLASVNRDELCSFLSETLSTSSINDYSCNGLQVEGTSMVSKIGLAVDACMETYKMATDSACQMLFVHHGIIWGGLTSISGRWQQQIRYLLSNDCNLYAAHLPLDMHPVLGNNAQLAKLIGLQHLTSFGVYKGIQIGFCGITRSPLSRDVLVNTLCRRLDTACTVLPFGNDIVRTIGIVSGGGADTLTEAIERRLDCLITGEPQHQNYHEALEAKINVIYAGHYHTEKVGVMAVGKLVEKTFGIKSEFLDYPTYI